MNYPSDYLSKVGKNANADLSAEDARLFIPPIVVPAFDIPRPAGVTTFADVSAADGPVITDSTIFEVDGYHQNAVAQDDTAFFLLTGVWVLEMFWKVQWDFAAAPAVLATVGNLAVMDQAGTRVNLLSHYSNSAARGLYSTNVSYRFHVKPRPDLSVVQGDVWTFFLQFPATNVAPTDQAEIQLTCNAQRYL